MSKYLLLLKYHLKTIDTASSTKKGSSATRAALVAVIAILLLPTYAMYFIFVRFLSETLALINQTAALYTLTMAVASMLVFVFGTAYVFTTFFSSKDTELLLALPVKPRAIVASKLTVLAIQYVLFSLIILPAVYWLAPETFLASYWANAAVMLIITPMIPLAAGSVISMCIMRVLGRKVSVDSAQYVVVTLTLAISFLISYATNKLSTTLSDPVSAAIFLLDNKYLMDLLSKAYYPSIFFSRAMLSSGNITGFLNLAIYTLLSFGSFFVAVLLGEGLYLDAATRQTSSKKKAKKEGKEYRFAKISKPLAIALCDLRVLVRTPTFAMNTLAMIVILPLLLAYYHFLLVDQAGNMFAFLFAAYPQTLAYACLLVVSLLDMSMITATSFSREGAGHWVTQSSPSSPSDQLAGRIMVAVLINTATSAILSAMIASILSMSFDNAALMCIASIIATIPIMLFALLVDLKRPRLDWDNPARAVKQNSNVLICLMVSAVYITVSGFAMYYSMEAGAHPGVVLIVYSAVNLAGSELLRRMFLSKYLDWIMDK
ncbi:MAG: hypothetical protein FWG10_10980 [Eubacteriaceae bacterium]|nr:hypothetical protein [Eubacteriaceae bacterium]